ncbi:aminopeptidase N [Paenarthrobacter sp. Z7-10]|uniref:aminopeptidase N n=1 Tax=Paenarthrobacter sp. Z7-10 TaxID=2787635 RepID=UPI0022A94E38|nr:aminopeptidase N [Paenarthrobacter sp. Z7-10]MCZ2402635.1 aminopeptidase N [Paenarthrobacter sp. Z7-10]
MSNANLSRDEARRRSSLIDVHSYDVWIDVRSAENPTAGGFGSISVISFSASEPGSETFLDFIGTEVHSVVLNGRDLPAAEAVDGARIRLLNLEPENSVTVTATGRYSNSGEGLHRFVDPADGRTYLYTQFEPADARRVYANFEQPDLKAPFTFHVSAPSSWEVASNGSVAAVTELAAAASADDNDGTPVPASSRWDFAPTKPISTYITSILAGPYFKVADHWSHPGMGLEIPLAAYCRLSLAEHFDSEQIFDLTKKGLTFFNELFDYPYPFGKYEQAFVPEYNLGAMENPGLVTFTESYVFTSRATNTQYQLRANTILHEMAHMWFGDLVTMSWWDDLWLKESFADFMGHLAVAEITDWAGGSWVLFANRRKAWAYLQDQLPSTHPIVADIRDLEAAKQNFDGITYAKGASVLKQLVAYVGFKAFTAGARQYFRDHAYGNTSLLDLLGALSVASDRDLSEWARHWLQTSGISTLTAELLADDGVLTQVSIVQDAVDPVSGAQQPRPHRLRVGFYDFSPSGALERSAIKELDVSGDRTELAELAGWRRPALLLVNDDDLSYAKIRLDPHSERTVLASMDRLANPMARALCWSALWNSARDALLPAADYVSAVERFAGSETDVGVLASLLANAEYAIEHYCAEDQRRTARESLLDAVVDRLHTAAPGSDLQLIWARALASLGRRTDSQHSLIAGLLSDGTVVPGLSVDSELRWSLWQALAAAGSATVAGLDAELASDNTASARVGHRCAVSARPTPQVKAEAWRAAVYSDELSNELLTATLEGFGLGPAALRSDYVQPYFAAIGAVWADRSIELSSRIVRGLFPGHQDLASGREPREHAVVEQTDAWLAANTQAPAALRRIVIEQRDHLMRSLRAQQRSMSRG